eukprot:TRINITY_DN1889_c0_g1_i2.p1 TRINITY_DN1889_c0_g1~~TRINITY_DN1889_c0_g1_i2.p1  ORF type:complete len:116 (-),score=9.67 TRINITY_DN1889_c0_g1_i2:19-366(-)
MGFFTIMYSGLGYYTLNLNTNYNKFIPLESVVRFKCICTNPQEGKRKIESLCQLFDKDTNEVLAEATSVFYHPPKDGPVYPFDMMVATMKSMTPQQVVEQINEQKRRARKSPAKL